MNGKLLEACAGQAADLLKAMSNDRRLHILCALVQGEKCVGELEQIVDISQSALSQHLARLRHDNLVSTRREAQVIYYSVSDDRVLKILGCLCEIFVHGRFDESQVDISVDGRSPNHALHRDDPSSLPWP